MNFNKFPQQVSINFNQFLQISIVALILFYIPVFAFAAVLYLEPSSGQYQPGDVFIVDIKIDTEGECINTVEGNLSFSQNILKANDFSQGQSIITIWVESPEINQDSGLISFSGGIPGGYCGRISGDPGPSDSLGKMIFRVHGMKVGEPGENLAEIRFLTTSRVLLNDGLGTKAKLDTQGAVFEIVEKIESPKDEWQEEIKKDNILPESFEVEICQESAIFEGKYFISFFTVDKQTGVDYYEIKEGKKDWKKIESPYLLEDQTLQSIIKVRVFDKAGNERIAEYLPPEIKKPFLYWLIILITFGIIIWGIWQKIFKK
ncbi:hypothetical protein KAU51_02610 [Candidatus Parcubacteria bacterium]|nr:hypothetical protein [Candidatus Parcubacteria bacterium]